MIRFTSPMNEGFCRRTLSSLELLSLTRAPNTTSEPSEGNDTVVVANIAEVGVCLLEVHSCTSRLYWFILICFLHNFCYTPERAAATSRMFLKWVRRYSPRARAAGDFALALGPTQTCIGDRSHSFRGWRRGRRQRSELDMDSSVKRTLLIATDGEHVPILKS